MIPYFAPLPNAFWDGRVPQGRVCSQIAYKNWGPTLDYKEVNGLVKLAESIKIVPFLALLTRAQTVPWVVTYPE
jgi:hypothetical protein